MNQRMKKFIIRRFNFLFLISFSFYAVSIASIILKEQAPEYFFPLTNILSNQYILYSAIAGSIVISFLQNRILVKYTHRNRILDRIVVLTCFELAIMLLGTFAALMFFLIVLFSQDFESQFQVIGFAIVLIILNILRRKIIERLNKNLRLN